MLRSIYQLCLFVFFSIISANYASIWKKIQSKRCSIMSERYTTQSTVECITRCEIKQNCTLISFNVKSNECLLCSNDKASSFIDEDSFVMKLIDSITSQNETKSNETSEMSITTTTTPDMSIKTTTRSELSTTLTGEPLQPTTKSTQLTEAFLFDDGMKRSITYKKNHDGKLMIDNEKELNDSTLTFWVKLHEATAITTFLTAGSFENNLCKRFKIRINKNRYIEVHLNPAEIKYSTVQLNVNVSYHVSIAIDPIIRHKVSIYINGTLRQEKDITKDFTGIKPQKIVVGTDLKEKFACAPKTPGLFSGILAEVYIWNEILHDKEIQELACGKMPTKTATIEWKSFLQKLDVLDPKVGLFNVTCTK